VRRVCKGSTVHREQMVWEPVVCVRVLQYTVSKQSGSMRRVCTDTPVHREQTVWEPVVCTGTPVHREQTVWEPVEWGPDSWNGKAQLIAKIGDLPNGGFACCHYLLFHGPGQGRVYCMPSSAQCEKT